MFGRKRSTKASSIWRRMRIKLLLNSVALPLPNLWAHPPGARSIWLRGFVLKRLRSTQALSEDPPENVVAVFDITREQWSVLSLELRERLESNAHEVIVRSSR